MKRILLLSMIGLSFQVNAQSVFYQETFGNVTAITEIANHSGYLNASPIVYTGNASIRNTTPSTDYTNASGEACVFLGASPTNPDQYILIEGIDSSNYTDITLSLGHYKGTNVGSNELIIDVSEDGEAWTALTYTRETGTGTSNWILIEPTGAIPAATNLRLRFTNPATSNVGFRIDDIKLSGIDATAANDNVLKEKFKLYPNPVSNGNVFITNQNNEELNVQIFDITGKMLKNVIAVDKVSIDGFASGIYLMKIETNGKSVTKKLVVK